MTSTDSPNPAPSPPSGPTPGGAVPPSVSRRDLDLIAAARRQARGVGSGGSGGQHGTGGHGTGGHGTGGGNISRSAWAVIPPDTIPGYELIKEIHRGGQGVVYQAIQKATKRKVAVKVMREGPFAGPRDKARFDREVEILAQMNHPNIVSIIDSGQAPASAVSGGAFYFVMDYISGHPLDQWMSLKDRTLEETLKLFARICDAVNSAHLKGVIHRDLKPGNIRVDTSDEPHVLDFGLAKIATGEVSDDDGSGGIGPMKMMTMTGQFVGSLPWASPEQAEGHPDKIDVRTDVYSLGVILYQMITGGKFPYEVIGAMRDVLDNILRATPQKPSTIRRQINDEVETIVLKSLAKERDRRYQNAGELARDVRNYLGGFPIEAKRDSAVYQLRVIARRNKGKVLGLGTIAALVVVFGASMAYLWRDASRQKAQKEAALAAESVERKRADENFKAVRGLARTFIHDINDEIAPLRGATRARATMLREARTYLEKLSAQAGDDVGLLREVADAADRVGDLETALNQPRVGDSASGAAAYAQARAIREKLLTRFPDDPKAHADAALSRVKTAAALTASVKHAQAREELEAAIAGYDRAIGMLPAGSAEANPIVDARAESVMELGNTISRIAAASDDIDTCRALEKEAADRYQRVISHWEERLRAESNSADAARQLAAARNARVDVIMNTASALSRRGGELGKGTETKPAGPAQAPAAAKAMFEEALRRYEEAIAQSERMVEEFERLSTATPQSAELRRGLWTALHARGFGTMCIGMTHRLGVGVLADAEKSKANGAVWHGRALPIYERMLAVAQGLSSADEADIDARRTLAISLTRVGNEHRDLGRPDQALEYFQKSLAIRRELLRTDPLTQHRRDLALGLFKCGEAEVLRARAAAEDAAKRERAQSASTFFTESLSIYNALAEEGYLEKTAREFATVTRGLDSARKILNPPEPPPPDAPPPQGDANKGKGP
ncbi:MAG: protein kinase domain-containing protein [Phycisphaerales bacterium]